MSSGGRSSLSDIMAAFNIPDQGDLPIQYSPIKGTPPSSTTPPASHGSFTPSSNISASSSNLATPPHGYHQYHGYSSESTPVSSGDQSFSSSTHGSYQSDYVYPPGVGNENNPQHLPENFLVYSKEDWPDPSIAHSSMEGNADMYEGGMHPSYSYEGMGKPRSKRGKKSKRERHQQTEANKQTRNRDRMRRLRQERTMEPEELLHVKSEGYDPFRSFRNVMSEEEKHLVVSGLSDQDKIQLLRELQDRVKKKQREAMRARRARLTPEQKEKEKIKARESKMQRRHDPLIEFRRFMTEEQRRQLMQPDLQPEVREKILTELNAVRRWVHREQTRKRRARLSLEQREDVRKKSRDYKRKARGNPYQALKCVMTEKHYELLQQELTSEQKEDLLRELNELKKIKQRDEMRARRAAFSAEQKEREREYSRKYKRSVRQKPILDIVYNSSGVVPSSAGDSAIKNEGDVPSSALRSASGQQGMHSPVHHTSPDATVGQSDPGQDSTDLVLENLPADRSECVRIKNRERQRIRRSMQTPEEREDERRKNRERSRQRREKKAKEEGRIFIPRWNATETGKGSRKRERRSKDASFQESNSSAAGDRKPTPHELQKQHSLPGNDGLNANPELNLSIDDSHSDITSPVIVTPSRSTIKRASMTEEQRERERARNRERARIKRLLQTPEEKAAHAERQRILRRRQREDPLYRARERERQRERKKKLRENLWYKEHELANSNLRRSKNEMETVPYDTTAVVQPQCVDENEETGSDISDTYTDTEVKQVGTPLQEVNQVVGHVPHLTNPTHEEQQSYDMDTSQEHMAYEAHQSSHTPRYRLQEHTRPGIEEESYQVQEHTRRIEEESYRVQEHTRPGIEEESYRVQEHTRPGIEEESYRVDPNVRQPVRMEANPHHSHHHYQPHPPHLQHGNGSYSPAPMEHKYGTGGEESPVESHMKHSGVPVLDSVEHRGVPVYTRVEQSRGPVLTGGSHSTVPVFVSGGHSSVPIHSTGGHSGVPVHTTGGHSGIPVHTTGGLSGVPVHTSGEHLTFYNMDHRVHHGRGPEHQPNDERMGKISSSLFNLQRIMPLNQGN